MSLLISTNPSDNYMQIGAINESTNIEIEDKIALAHKAFTQWKNIGLERRIAYLRKVLEALLERKEDLATLISKEMGMPITEAYIDVEGALSDYFTWYLDNALTYLSPEITNQDASSISTVYYEPVGVVVAISPWNFPLSNFVWSCGANLVAGNTVVFKHSEECPLTGKLIENIIASTNLPEGVFNEVYGAGEVGNVLVHQDIQMICFTGSAKVGKELYKIASEKFIKVLLELGGSAPAIVFDDVDVDEIVPLIYAQKFLNNGQVCDGLKRLIVHERKYHEVARKLAAYAQKKKVGNAIDKTTDLGPLVAQRQLELLEAQVKDAVKKGAQVITGGKRPAGLSGAYYLPTILKKITPDMRVWKEEVFGPVLPVVQFTTEEEAIQLANDTIYGLGSYIFTQDPERADRIASQLQTGMVSINGGNYVIPSNPFGGMKHSGIGREHGKYGLREVCDIKVITKKL